MNENSICTLDCLSNIGLPCNCAGLPVVPVHQSPTIPFEQQKTELLVIASIPVCLSTCIPEFGIHAENCPLSPKAVVLPVCTICQNDIPRFSIETSMGLVCLDCGLCASCGDQVTITEIEFCMTHTAPIQHPRCRMKQTGGNGIKIPVSEFELGVLNNCRLIIVPGVERSIETNVSTALLAHGMLWESMTLEQKFMHTQMIEAVYSSAYMALKKDPTEVKTKLRERDVQRTTQAHAQAKKDRQTQLPSEKRKIGLQEKFMNGMLGSGVTKEQAKAIWVSQGRVWVE